MAQTKHVGKLINTQRRVVVVFREIPDDHTHALVVDTDGLPDWMHDDIINAVNSPGAQQSSNFYEYANRQVFNDGTNMLQSLHKRGLLQKVDTENVMMTPNASATIRLDKLNDMIAEQTGSRTVVPKDTTQMEMAHKNVDAPAQVVTPTGTPDVIDDGAIAKNMLTQAEQFEQEAKQLREQAYELNPDLKPKRGRKPKTQTT